MLTPDLVQKVLAYLPAHGSATFINTAREAVQLRQTIQVYNESTLQCFLSLRGIVQMPAPLGDLTTARDRVVGALQHQILSIVGVNNGTATKGERESEVLWPCTNTRLLRLVGEGPWPRNTNFDRLRAVMDLVFGGLIEKATHLVGRFVPAYLVDLNAVCTACAGVHGWVSASWQNRLSDALIAHNRACVGYSCVYWPASLQRATQGMCEHRSPGHEPCGWPCEECSRAAEPHHGECLCHFHKGVAL
jgi:hypothetical protein